MKGKPKLHIFYEYQLHTYLTVDSVIKLSDKLTKIVHISFAIFKQLTTFKIIEHNRVSIFSHEILRISVILNFDLKFWSEILS